jgi:hypothetical protein
VGRRERIEARLEDWGRSVHRHPWRAIGVMLAVTLGLASGAADLRFEASTENYLDPADPERSSYQAFRRQFVNDDTILLILHSERIFSFEFLARLRALHEDLEREVPLVDEVTSLINARVTRGSEDELIVEDLLETWPRSQAELEAVARRARSNPVYTNLLLSEDARFTTVTVNVTPTGGTTPDEGLGGFGEDGAEEGMAPASVEEVPILEGAELIRVVERLSEVTERHASADFPIYVTGNPDPARHGRLHLGLAAGDRCAAATGLPPPLRGLHPAPGGDPAADCDAGIDGLGGPAPHPIHAAASNLPAGGGRGGFGAPAHDLLPAPRRGGRPGGCDRPRLASLGPGGGDDEPHHRRRPRLPRLRRPDADRRAGNRRADRRAARPALLPGAAPRAGRRATDPGAPLEPEGAGDAGQGAGRRR